MGDLVGWEKAFIRFSQLEKLTGKITGKTSMLTFLKDETKNAIFATVRKHCEEIWSGAMFPNPQAVIHGVPHSEAIITILGRLLEPYMTGPKALNQGEIVVLLCSALAHDVGYLPQEQQQDYDFEIARANHPQRSYDYIMSHLEIFDERAGPLIALCSRGHREVPMKKGYYDDKMMGSDPIRLQFLTALLRLADELDLTVDRAPKPFFDLIKQYYGSDMSDFTILQWMRHYYTEGIRIEHSIRNGTSYIRFSVFSYIPLEGYEKFIVEPWIVEPIRRAIMDTYEALARENIILDTDVSYQTFINPKKDQLPFNLYYKQQRSVLDAQIQKSVVRYDYRRVSTFLGAIRGENRIFNSPILRLQNLAEYSLFNNSDEKTWLAGNGAFLIVSTDIFSETEPSSIDESFVEGNMAFNMEIVKNHSSMNPTLEYVPRELLPKDLRNISVQALIETLRSKSFVPSPDKIFGAFSIETSRDLQSIHCRYLYLEPIQPGERIHLKYNWNSTVLPWDNISTTLMHYTKNIDFTLESFPEGYWMKTTANLLVRKGIGARERVEPDFEVHYGKDATQLSKSVWLAPGTQISTVWKNTAFKLLERARQE